MRRTAPLLILLLLLLTVTVSAAGPFFGSKNSNVYHYTTCSQAARIKPANEVWFDNEDDAVARGYRPCDYCHPPLGKGTVKPGPVRSSSGGGSHSTRTEAIPERTPPEKSEVWKVVSAFIGVLLGPAVLTSTALELFSPEDGTPSFIGFLYSLMGGLSFAMACVTMTGYAAIPIVLVIMIIWVKSAHITVPLAAILAFVMSIVEVGGDDKRRNAEITGAAFVFSLAIAVCAVSAISFFR